MWEYRLIWPLIAPEWWERAWESGEKLLERQGREPEERPDRYLVIDERPDVGLKLRGGAEEELDMKVRHRRQNGWELWEKVTFFRWNALEARRFALLLQQDLALDAVISHATPSAGAKKLLEAAGIPSFVVELEKRRMQARADELVPGLGRTIQPDWLAELVEFRVEPGAYLVRSVCFETMSPSTSPPLEARDARCAGYPEFLMP